ncbi:hypothetical protein FA95DRAFT_1611147 [Auriscalpium vulgare]|uniref:Uncharacterized protein n=1 Tax=Auriscalpium vulgare TaxID=40419 RepID=A0ACB8RAW9_9AGAM|nr:hypothetical protein FA95DRAFT_1611147 [Auriscalpium vulgare]
MNTATANIAVGRQAPPSVEAAQDARLYAATGRLRLAYRSRPVHSNQLRWFAQGIAREIQFIPALLGRHAVEHSHPSAITPSINDIRWLGRSVAAAEVSLDEIYKLLPLGPEPPTMNYTEQRVGNAWWEDCQIRQGDMPAIIYDLHQRWSRNRMTRDEGREVSQAIETPSGDFEASLDRLAPVMRQDLRAFRAHTASIIRDECLEKYRAAAELDHALSLLYSR